MKRPGNVLFGWDWVVISEIFPNRIRGAATRITGSDSDLTLPVDKWAWVVNGL